MNLRWEIITLRETLKALCKKETQAMMYFVRNYEVEEESDSGANSVQQGTTQDHKLRKLLDEYDDVFKDKLPNQLAPSRDLVHEIDTSDNASVNIQAYQLTKSTADEQTNWFKRPQQVTDALGPVAE